MQEPLVFNRFFINELHSFKRFNMLLSTYRKFGESTEEGLDEAAEEEQM